VDYHTFLLTNFSAVIWQQTVFVPLFKLLSSIKQKPWPESFRKESFTFWNLIKTPPIYAS